MSDFGRKNISDKISESVTPESQKSTIDQAKEAVTGTLDKAVASATPENQKSFTQSVSDNVQEGHDDGKKAVEQTNHSFAETATEYVEAAKKEVGAAAAYVSEVLTGASEGAKTAQVDATKK